MGALEVRAKSNLYELPKKEANRILSKCEQANRIEEAPFSASLSTDRGGNLEFHKMPSILASRFLNRNPRPHCQKTAIYPRQLGCDQVSRLKGAERAME